MLQIYQSNSCKVMHCGIAIHRKSSHCVGLKVCSLCLHCWTCLSRSSLVFYQSIHLLSFLLFFVFLQVQVLRVVWSAGRLKGLGMCAIDKEDAYHSFHTRSEWSKKPFLNCRSPGLMIFFFAFAALLKRKWKKGPMVGPRRRVGRKRWEIKYLPMD